MLAFRLQVQFSARGGQLSFLSSATLPRHMHDAPTNCAFLKFSNLCSCSCSSSHVSIVDCCSQSRRRRRVHDWWVLWRVFKQPVPRRRRPWAAHVQRAPGVSGCATATTAPRVLNIRSTTPDEQRCIRRHSAAGVGQHEQRHIRHAYAQTRWCAAAESLLAHGRPFLGGNPE